MNVKRMLRMSAGLGFAIAVVAGHTMAGGWIPLHIDEPVGVERTDWPVRGGIPFPRGAVKSIANFRLLDDAGDPVPFQATRLAVWPDGSLKWVLFDFNAHLRATKGATYRLEYGKGVKAPSEGKKILARDDGRRIVVDTGPLKFIVPKSGGKLISRAWLDLDGDGVFSPAESLLSDAGITGFFQVLRSSTYRVGRADIDGTLDVARLQVDSAVVEVPGPLKAVICLRGRYIHRHMPPSPFTVRLYARRGSSSLRMVHTFVYTGEPKVDFPAGIGIDITLRGDKADMVLTFGTDKGGVGFPNGREGFDHGALIQNSHMDYEVWKAAGGDHGPVRLFSGARAPGWADLSSGRFGCTVGLRNMWQEYPQEIGLDGRTGSIKACFYPVHGPVMDLRRYSDKMYRLLGETTFFRFSGSFTNEATAAGLAKTHECVIRFHPGAVDDSRAKSVSDWLNHPSLVYVTPEWYRDTRVLGYYHVLDRENFPRLERTLERYFDFFRASQEYWGWYSWVDYGDIGHMWGSRFKDTPDGPYQVRHEWDYDIGRWGWTNTEGLPGLWFHLQWLRTGERKYFIAAEAMARHTRDIDIFHWGHNKGRGHTRHNVNHWGDGDYEDRISAPIGYSLNYFLTGDERSRDVIEEVVDGHYLARKEPAASSTLATHLYGVLVRWEMTGDRKYERMLRKAVDAFIDAQNPETGAYPDRAVVVVATGEPTGLNPRESDGNGMFLHNFGLMQALIDYYNLTGYKRLARSLIRHADLCVKRKRGASNHSRVLSFAARLTGDRKYVETLRKRIKGYGLYEDQVNPDPNDWTGPNAYMKPHGTYFVSAFGHDLPYAMEVLGREDRE